MVDHLLHCAISGKRLEPDDAIIQTEHGAYGVKANLLRELTDERRAEIEARLFPSEETVTDDSHNDADSDSHPDGAKRSHRRHLSGGHVG
jgi:hypothetical protein